MKNPLIWITVITFLTGAWFVFAKQKQIPRKKKIERDPKEAESFVARIEELGYFKYADSSNVEKLKSIALKDFDPKSELFWSEDEETLQPMDYRHYFCDGEDVYEEGGIPNLLNELKPSFEKMKFKCDIQNFKEGWDEKNKCVNSKITINGTEYIIFDCFSDGFGWGEAPMRIAEIINKELDKQGIDEQIYLMSGGNDGRLVFLSKELYNYLYSVYKNPEWKPLEINEWAKVMKVK